MPIDIISQLVCSDEGITILLTIVIILLKLYINNRATQLQMKELIVSIPGEIEILVIGFLISDLTSDGASDNSVVALMLFAFIFLILQFKCEKNFEGQLSGNWSVILKAKVFGLYFLSIVLFVLAVMGGK